MLMMHEVMTVKRLDVDKYRLTTKGVQYTFNSDQIVDAVHVGLFDQAPIRPLTYFVTGALSALFMVSVWIGIAWAVWA